MSRFFVREAVDFDDVLIIPRPSMVNSRNEVNISVTLSENLTIGFPVIASPMKGIVDSSFAKNFAELGGLTILHRFYENKKIRLKEIDDVKDLCYYGVAIGMNDQDSNEILAYEPSVVVIDVANGYTSSLLQYCEEIKNRIVSLGYKTLLMSGNVVTSDGVDALYNSGVDLIRVGIGGGALCTTRNITGIGIPQVTAIQNCLSANGKIVADGGIRNSGDIVKSFVAGADIVMAGTIFAKTHESPSKNTIYGMASKKLQEEQYGEYKSIEGLEVSVHKTETLKSLVDEISWGIKSAATYLNARNIDEIYRNGEFIHAGKNSIKQI